LETSEGLLRFSCRLKWTPPSAITNVDQKLSARISSSDLDFFLAFGGVFVSANTDSGPGVAAPLASATIRERIEFTLPAAAFEWCGSILAISDFGTASETCSNTSASVSLPSALQAIGGDRSRTPLLYGRNNIQCSFIYDDACIGMKRIGCL
jgi:hypothetical protein